MSVEAVRHLVYSALLDFMPAASAEQVDAFAGNLGLDGSDRLLRLKVTPDVGETNSGLMVVTNETSLPLPGWGRADVPRVIESMINKRFGDKLAGVPGFYRRNENAPFRMNLPTRCALFGYGEIYPGPSRLMPSFYTGILCQPLDRPQTFFLLSSAKLGGPKAARLAGADRVYFTQFEEIESAKN